MPVALKQANEFYGTFYAGQKQKKSAWLFQKFASEAVKFTKKNHTKVNKNDKWIQLHYLRRPLTRESENMYVQVYIFFDISNFD